MIPTTSVRSDYTAAVDPNIMMVKRGGFDTAGWQISTSNASQATDLLKGPDIEAL